MAPLCRWIAAVVLAVVSGAEVSADVVPPLASGPWGARDPVADRTVTVGSARFTVLTDRVFRMEFVDGTEFEDRATMAIINRKLPTVDYDMTNDGTVLALSTKYLKLTYTIGAEFSADSLSIESLDDSSAFQSWHYGQADRGNLLGTIRTLDGEDRPTLNCTLVQSRMDNQCGWDASDCQCEWGVVGREGWALVDDSANYALSEGSDFWDGPNVDTVDLYFFGHGHDYKGALKDFVGLSGSVALPPRHALGVWFTRWYDFTQSTAEAIVADFEKRSLPLDVLVLDMNWHTKNDWTGYTFDERLFPHREDMFQLLHARGLLSAGNLHDADGVGNFEAQFGALCEVLGLDPSTIDNVPYNISDEAAQLALEDSVLLPLEGADGFDFWWIDWQQGEAGAYGAVGGKMNPTIWTAHQRSTDKQRRGSTERGMVLARWGGLGGHRYQVGFSGDVKDVSWETLSYQPYFSTTAANVAFGFWSHDITGPATDEELYVRWLQWGAYSGVLRMHDRGESAGPCNDPEPGSDSSSSTCFLVRPWEAAPANFEAMRTAIDARGKLLPYLYTALRETHDEGLSLLRPLYYEHPEEEMAYMQSVAMPQYYLGPDLLVSPIVTAMNPTTGLATQPLWIPPGTFLERDTGVLHSGQSSQRSESSTCGVKALDAAIDCAVSENVSEAECGARGCCWSSDYDAAGDAPACYFSDEMVSAVVMKQADLAEVPVLVRAGAILVENGPPTRVGDLIGRAARGYDSLVFSVFLSGAESGSTRLYEDDGRTTDYTSNNQSYAFTDAKWRYETSGDDIDDSDEYSKGIMRLTVGAAGSAGGGGGFVGLPSARDYEFRFVNSPPPLTVAVQSQQAHASRHRPRSPQDFTWFYDGAAAELVIVASNLPTAEALDIAVTVALPGNPSSEIKFEVGAAKSHSLEYSHGKLDADTLLSGVRGTLRRAVQAKELLNEARVCPGEATGQTEANGYGAMQRLASTGSVLTHSAMVGDVSGFWSTVTALPESLTNARAELDAINATSLGNSQWRLVQAKAMLQAAAVEMRS